MYSYVLIVDHSKFPHRLFENTRTIAKAISVLMFNQTKNMKTGKNNYVDFHCHSALKRKHPSKYIFPSVIRCPIFVSNNY